MNKYGDKIIFYNEKRNSKNPKLKLIIFLSLFFIFITTIIGTMIYSSIYTPTDLTETDIIQLIDEEESFRTTIIDNTKGVAEIKDIKLTYINNMAVYEVENISATEVKIHFGFTVNYTNASAYGSMKAVIKYKKGWYVDSFSEINISELMPDETAGDAFLFMLTNDIYGDGEFKFNNISYRFSVDYVRSLVTITEEGDFNSTKVGVAKYNKEKKVDIYATMKYNFETMNWELIDFYFAQ